MADKISVSVSAERLAELELRERNSKKYWIRTRLLLDKARAAGLKVSDKEIDEYLAKK